MAFADSLRQIDPDSLPRFKRWVHRPALFVTALLDQCGHDKLIIRASGLAYASLLAAVPLVAVLLALFVAFAAFDEVEQRLREVVLSQLLPARQEEILGYLQQFTSNTRSLGLVGFVLLVITAILLLDNIESNFNEIWHVSSRRSLVSKITAYTSVLVFGSVFLGASLSISARIKAALFAGTRPELPLLSRFGSSLLPLGLTFVALLMMYLVIPHSRVRLPCAVSGAALAAVLWEVAKNVFANTVGESVQYSTLYGSLAAIPIFLVWLYLSWIIVMLGLETAYTHQHFAVLARYRAVEDPTPRDRVALALKLFLVVAERYQSGQPPPTFDELARRFLVPLRWVETHACRLAEAGLVAQVSSGDSTADALLPSRPLDDIRISDVFAAVWDGRLPRRPTGDTVETAVDELVNRLRTAGDEVVGRTSVRDFLSGLATDAVGDLSSP